MQNKISQVNVDVEHENEKNKENDHDDDYDCDDSFRTESEYMMHHRNSGETAMQINNAYPNPTGQVTLLFPFDSFDERFLSERNRQRIQAALANHNNRTIHSNTNTNAHSARPKTIITRIRTEPNRNRLGFGDFL